MSDAHSDTERLEADDSPPHGRSVHHVPVSSFDSDCREAWARVERKVDRLLGSQGRTETAAAVIDERVKNLEKWRDELMSVRAQSSMGIRFAIIGSIAGPVLMLTIHLLTMHAKGSP